MKRNEWPIVIAIAAVALVVMMLVQRPTPQYTPPAPIPTSNPFHVVQHDTFMVYNIGDWNKIPSGDEPYAVKEGLAVVVLAGTQVRVLDIQDDSFDVRIQSGDHAGQRGYIKNYAFR